MPETLVVTKENALKAYDSANDKGKNLLSNLFGKQVFERKITDRVKTFEDALQVLGLNSSSLAAFVGPDEKSIIAYSKLIIIARALNEGWVPDWGNENQYKYYPFFRMKSGSGLSYDDCAGTCSNTGVGSRLSFKTAELATYAGQQFEALYQDYLSL